VRVRGTRFVVGCPAVEYKIVGWNTYTLIEQAARVPVGSFGADFSRRGRAQVIEMLDDAVASGFNTVRTWAYNVGERQPMQTHPGVYHEPSFEGLDWVLREAGKRGVRLILVLTDYWEYHGGVSQYLDWAAAMRRGGGGGLTGFFDSGASSKSSFFSDPDCKRMYKANARALIERVNRYTGVQYRHDETIFAWELINEPRCRGCGDRLQAWIEEMAKYVKSLDPNHLLSTGEEGFYSANSRGSASVNPEVWASTTGQDFVENHAVPEIDFAVAHLWPDNWGVFTLGGSLAADFTEEWIRAHTRDATRVLGKPFVLEEFGVVGPGRGERGAAASILDRRRGGIFSFFGGGFGREAPRVADDDVVASYYRNVYDLVERADSADRALRGSMFWTWHHDDLKPLALGEDEYAVFVGDSAFEATTKHAKHFRGGGRTDGRQRAVIDPACGGGNDAREAQAIGETVVDDSRSGERRWQFGCVFGVGERC
jgi:mannan endo-1,4-beta-mannosidase